MLGSEHIDQEMAAAARDSGIFSSTGDHFDVGYIAGQSVVLFLGPVLEVFLGLQMEAPEIVEAVVLDLRREAEEMLHF
jgi:hypothetical protein